MTFSDWYYNRATAEERRECREEAERTKAMDPLKRTQERARYAVKKLLHGKGGTVVTDVSKGHLRWRIREAEGWDEMQFGSVEEALRFCREEPGIVGAMLGSIIPVKVVVPDGTAEGKEMIL